VRDLKYDLVVKGGLLVDPSQGIEGQRDVAVSGSKVSAVEVEIDPKLAEKTIDASGKIVSPGLIDLHAHVYRFGSRQGVDPDLHCLAKGVTTVVDGGSSGALNFMGFRRYVIESCRTRVLGFLNVSDVGLTMGKGIGELEDLRHFDFDRTVEVARENRDVIVGIKIRVPKEVVGQYGPQCLRLAKGVSRVAGMPLMVHPGSLHLNLPLTDVLRVLEKGDIMTHCYPPPYPPLLLHPSVFEEDGALLPEVYEARRRGVLFDVAHGVNNFSWDTAEKALNQNFTPTTISTDLTVNSLHSIVYDLPTVISMFLNLGLSLSAVIEHSTIIPATILGLEDRIGTLKVGAEADIAIFEMAEGKFPLWDNIRPVKKQRIINKLLTPIKVVKGGRAV